MRLAGAPSAGMAGDHEAELGDHAGSGQHGGGRQRRVRPQSGQRGAQRTDGHLRAAVKARGRPYHHRIDAHRLAQRVPVRFALDAVPEEARLVAGLTATVSVTE